MGLESKLLIFRNQSSIFCSSFLESFDEECENAKISFSQIEKYALINYLNIDKDGLIKKEFLSSELKKVLNLLNKNQIPNENLLQKEDTNYTKHFQLLKTTRQEDDPDNDISLYIHKLIRSSNINPKKFYDSLGIFLMKNISNVEISPQHQIFISPSYFSEFWQQKWNHKVNEEQIRKLLDIIKKCVSHSMSNLDDGLMDHHSKGNINVNELVKRIQVLQNKYKQNGHASCIKISFFVIKLFNMNISPEDYFKQHKMNSLNKLINFNKFHFICSSFLNFMVEDSNSEFEKIQKQMNNKINFSDFILKITKMKNKFINRQMNSTVIQLDESGIVENKSFMKRSLKSSNYIKRSKLSYLFFKFTDQIVSRNSSKKESKDEVKPFKLKKPKQKGLKENKENIKETKNKYKIKPSK